jgi:hypothetical protein
MTSTELYHVTGRVLLPLTGGIARHWSRFGTGKRQLVRFFGPGWISGASDDDLDPIKALCWCAVINDVIAVPPMCIDQIEPGFAAEPAAR